MKDILLLIATGVLAALGFALIAFSQKQHWRLGDLADAGKSPIAFRLAGSLLIGLAILPAVIRDGLAFGLLVWTATLTVAALLVIAGLAKLRSYDDQRQSR